MASLSLSDDDLCSIFVVWCWMSSCDIITRSLTNKISKIQIHGITAAEKKDDDGVLLIKYTSWVCWQLVAHWHWHKEVNWADWLHYHPSIHIHLSQKLVLFYNLSQVKYALALPFLALLKLTVTEWHLAYLFPQDKKQLKWVKYHVQNWVCTYKIKSRENGL